MTQAQSSWGGIGLDGWLNQALLSLWGAASQSPTHTELLQVAQAGGDEDQVDHVLSHCAGDRK